MHASLTNLRSTAESQGLEAETPEARTEYDRIERAAQFAQDRLAETDPFLAPPGILNDLQSNADAAFNSLTAYKSSGDVGQRNQAQSHVDTVVRLASQLAVPVSIQDLDGFRDHISSVRRSAGQHLANMERDAEGFRERIAETDQARVESQNRLAELSAEIKQDKGRLDAAISEFQSQFSQAQESRRTEFTDDQKVVNAAHQAKLQAIETEFEELRATVSTEANTALETARVQADAERSEQNEESASHIQALSGLEEQAVQIVGAIARTGMAGGYQQEADSQQKSARKWRWVVVGSLVAVAVAAAYALLAARQPGAGGLDLGVFFARLGLGLPMVLLAGYAMRQADKHERSERRLRKIQLELASLGAYLELMPEAQRLAIQGDLVSRFFSPLSTEETESDHASIQVAAGEQALGILKDILKR
ncbi:hypothetical protein HQ535_11545 [bacterium]|nr:hypothetical protein [bacterium]